MQDSKYCYPGTDILINKLNIKNDDLLEKAERILSGRRMDQLLKNPIHGSFDFDHLKAIHRYIFQDLYSWAGKERTVNIAKSNMFCNVMFLDRQAAEIFGKLSDENLLAGLTKNEFVERVSYFFGGINALHPFREGNGRAQREFFRELALHAGHQIDFSVITEDEMIEASVDSFSLEYSKLNNLLQRAVIK